MDDTSLNDFLDGEGDDIENEDDDLEGEDSAASDGDDPDTTAETTGNEAEEAKDRDRGSERADSETADSEEVENETSEEIAPATTTYQFAPAGESCAACGETVARRWESEAGLVCGACKEW